MDHQLTLRNFLELNGRSVKLQKLERKFAALYLEHMGNLDVETTVLTTTANLFSGDDIERYIDRITSDDSRLDLLIFDCESGRLAGEIVLMDIDPVNRNAHLRMAIARKEDYGRGYGTEALLLALNYGFGMLHLHRIELEVLSYNTRALHVYEKLGFRKEGLRRDACFFNHRFHDIVAMSLLEEEFRQQHLEGMENLESLL